MEIAVTYDEAFYPLHDESTLSMLAETDPLVRFLPGLEPWILEELDDLVESEGGLLIP